MKLRLLGLMLAWAAGARGEPSGPVEGAYGALGPAPARPPPAWAYPIATLEPILSLRTTPYRLAGSAQAYTLDQVHDLFSPPDWHPEAHRPMPEIVAHGRKPSLWACGYCHFPDGQGRPENAALAGLPVDYIVGQVADFRSGRRKSAEPRMDTPWRMVAVAQIATPEEVAQAAAYFSQVPFRSHTRLVETERVPRTAPVGSELKPVGRGRTEPIAGRIIEVAEDFERTALRDAAAGFVAYVPVGSVARGGALAVSGGAGKTVACAACHGPNLRGSTLAPPLAGRSPSYLFRQLFDFQVGSRAGPKAPVMAPVVARLSSDDLTDLAAYLASCPP